MAPFTDIYTVFLDEAKFGVAMRNRHRVLEIGKLLYEATSMKKMRALWSSAWQVSRGVYNYLGCFGLETIIKCRWLEGG